MAKLKSTQQDRGRTCCGVVQEARYEVRERQARRAKQPWIVLKCAVGLTIGIIGYSSYVYIGTLCVPMLLERDNALSGRATGVVFLVIFCSLLLMILWAYVKAVLTPPGFAKQFVSKTSQPGIPGDHPPRRSWESSEPGAVSYESLSPPTVDLSRYVNTPPEGGTPLSEHRSVSYPQRTSLSEKSRQQLPHGSAHIVSGGQASTIPDDDSAFAMDNLPVSARMRTRDYADLPPPLYSRRPITTPILLPEYRYCSRDEIVKPFRAHHCRACGSCVLKYDHHCPWVGQCVGALNHKFFVNFLEWAVAFCLWILATVIGMNAKASSNDNFNINPQHIVLIALSGLFSLFTIAMLFSHVILIIMNQTTVESLGNQAMKTREGDTLRQMFAWYQFGKKRQTLRQWDREWGRIGKEGNLWWLGSYRANWEAIMGKNPWWWFLPIGRPIIDGLSYPRNPRFDDQGRWRPRKEWPAELQRM